MLINFSKKDLDIINPPLTAENKFWVLTYLGFSPRGKSLWYHPTLSADINTAWIMFDLQTDDLVMIVRRIYKAGYADHVSVSRK